MYIDKQCADIRLCRYSELNRKWVMKFQESMMRCWMGRQESRELSVVMSQMMPEIMRGVEPRACLK